MPNDLLHLRDFRIGFAGAARPVLDGVDLTMQPGEIRALVGESGSGKTMLARALVDLLPAGADVSATAARFQGRDLLDAGTRRSLRGRDVAFIFQEPLSSLNPTLHVGVQMTEALARFTGRRVVACRAEAIEMLQRVHIHDAAGCLDRYPHELSGGMRQRVMIAAALLTRPALVIADEPTTALDLVVQNEVLSLLRTAAVDLGIAVLLITHDLSVVAGIADRVTVLEHGKVVEDAPAAQLLTSPVHAYSRRLLDAVFHPVDAHDAPVVPVSATPLLSVQQVSVKLPGRRGKTILNGVTLDVAAGETVAVIGESGSGKTTLARVACGLVAPTGGTISFDGAPLDLRQPGSIQMIFQDPYGSLDPRQTIADSILEGLRLRGARIPDAAARVASALRDVGLDPAMAKRLPHELSGGQRQRVSIARAIIVRPRLIVADEPVSALDLTVQKQILELLRRLQEELGFGCLFVSHDLGVVEHVADRVLVLLHGHLVELGPRAGIFTSPHHPYTRRLIAATPLAVRTTAGGFAIAQRDIGMAPACEGGSWFDPAAAGSSVSPGYLDVGPGHRVAVRAG